LPLEGIWVEEYQCDLFKSVQRMARVVLVINEKVRAGGDTESAVKQVQRLGIDLDVRSFCSKKALGELVEQAAREGTGRVVVGGGDGTLNAVVNSLMRVDQGTQVSLGIVPLGTANDFARGVGLDGTNLVDTIKLACTGTPTRIDVGQMNDQYFVNVASAGFGAEVTTKTPGEMKAVLGEAAYHIMGFVSAFQARPYEARLTLPGGVVEEGPILVMAVGNSRFAGGGYEVAPRASLTDGLLDLAIVRSTQPIGLVQLLGGLDESMNFQEDEQLLYRQVSSLSLRTQDPVQVNLDGEPEHGVHFQFRCHPSALSVVLGNTLGKGQ